MTSVRFESMIFTRVVSDELFERAGAKAPRLAWHRARKLPALGIPLERRRRRLATTLSIVIHVLMVWFLLRPEAIGNMNPDLKAFDAGGGGPGPAGGGGGGTRGTGGVKFITVVPPPTPVVPPPTQPVLPPVLPVLELPKPVVIEPALPQLEVPKLAMEPKAEVKIQSPLLGSGGGTGNDGTRGNGPGTGGGIGTGIGTGRGSGVGPGTGGGPNANYPPTMIEMPVPPIPVPAKVKGQTIVVVFDVDEKGKIIDFEFTPTKDGDYNRRLRDLCRTFRFRPGHTPEGVPIRAKVPWQFTAW